MLCVKKRENFKLFLLSDVFPTPPPQVRYIGNFVYKKCILQEVDINILSRSSTTVVYTFLPVTAVNSFRIKIFQFLGYLPCPCLTQVQP